MKAVVVAFKEEKALVGAFSVITNLWMEPFQTLDFTMSGCTHPPPDGQPLLPHSLGQPLHGVDDGAAAATPTTLVTALRWLSTAAASAGALAARSQLTTLPALFIAQLTSTDMLLLLARHGGVAPGDDAPDQLPGPSASGHNNTTRSSRHQSHHFLVVSILCTSNW